MHAGAPRDACEYTHKHSQALCLTLSLSLSHTQDNLRIREGGDGGVFVEGLSEHVVRSPNDVYTLLQQGKAQRATNSTRMNKVWATAG